MPKKLTIRAIFGVISLDLEEDGVFITKKSYFSVFRKERRKIGRASSFVSEQIAYCKSAVNWDASYFTGLTVSGVSAFIANQEQIKYKLHQGL